MRYYIMSGDIETVLFDDAFEYEILNEQLAPIYVKNCGNIKRWIEERAVDPTRANSRAVKARQGISKNAPNYETSMKSDAATITDNFWVKKEGDRRRYEEIVFRKNDFFSLALYRDFSGLSLEASRTPELTSIGAREKGWKLVAGRWWLYKNEPKNEMFSEYLTCRIGMAMGYDMAYYQITKDKRFIKTRDFTEGRINLQHIDGFVVDHEEDGKLVPDDDYSYNYSKLKSLSSELAEAYLQICVLDALCENYDRHTKNYGFLTDQKTGQILSLAPNYDNNNSLYANYGLDINRQGGLLREFLRFADKEGIALQIPMLQKEELEGIIDEAAAKTAFDFEEQSLGRKELTGFLLNGLRKLKGE